MDYRALKLEVVELKKKLKEANKEFSIKQARTFLAEGILAHCRRIREDAEFFGELKSTKAHAAAGDIAKFFSNVCRLKPFW